MKKILITFIVFLCFAITPVFANNIKQYTLPTGQQVVIKEDTSNPIVVIDTFIKTGSVNENDYNNGVAHFLEHLFFKGTTNYKRGEFEKILEKHGGVFNAATSRDYTHYYIKIDKKYFDEALALHSDMLLNVSIPQDELDMERKVVMEEITRSNDNPESLLFDNFMKIIFNGNSYGRKILGSNKIIKEISRDEILKFHDTWYIPQNMVTVVVGDVNAKSVLPKIKKSFSSNSTNLENTNKVFKTNPQLLKIKNNTIVEKADVDTAYIMLGYKTVGINNPKEAYALGIAATILADGQNSILYKKLKNDNNLIIDTGAGNYELKNQGIFYVNATLEPKNYNEVLSKINIELQNLKTRPIDEKRINLVKNSLKRGYIYANESYSNIANMLGYDVAIGNGIEDYENYLNVIDSITPEFVQATVNKYFTKDNYALSVVLPKTCKITNSSNKNYSNNYDAKLISQYKNIKKYKLQNGATLILEKTDNNNIISGKIFIKGGSLSENKVGTASILADSIMLGTKNKNAKEIADYLDNIGTNVSISDDFEYFEISIKTTKNDMGTAFGILKELLEEPEFLQKNIDIVKKDTLDTIKATKDNPQNVAFENFYEGLYENSPFLKTGKILEKSIPNITRNDIIELYNHIFAPKNMIISLTGNFDEKDIINKFSSLKNNKTAILYDTNNLKIPLDNLTSNIIKTESKNSKGAWLVQGWKTKGLSSKDFVTLKVISTYLGTGFTSRLFENLREKKGLAYEVGSSSTSHFLQGNFFMYIGTNPNNLNIVKREFANEINTLKTTKISEKDLQYTKDMLIGRLQLATETNMSKAYMNGYYELFDKGYKFRYDYPKMIQGVSSQDIKDIAIKYFSKPYIISIVAEDKYLKLQGEKE